MNREVGSPKPGACFLFRQPLRRPAPRLREHIAIERIVIVLEKGPLPPIAALGDVMGNAG